MSLCGLCSILLGMHVHVLINRWSTENHRVPSEAPVGLGHLSAVSFVKGHLR